MERDPVCGMEVKDISKAEKMEYKGKTYYFCSNSCKSQFGQNPEKYIDKQNKDEHKHHN
jgi:YHS domain-containing protein